MYNDRTQVKWTKQTLQMQNGFGAMLGTDVLCDVDNKTSAVVDFFIN